MTHGTFVRQRERLALRLDEVLRGYLSDTATPEVNDTLEEVYGEFAIGKYPDTREMRFFLQDVNCFSAELANLLRRLVAREFPKWVVVPQFDECVFTVQADGVKFGDEFVIDDLRDDTPAFVRWWAGALDYDEQRYGPLRRQLRWLRPRVPDLLPRLTSERAVLIGAFDRLGSSNGSPVWLLVRPQDRNVSVGSIDAPDESYGVNADGSLQPRHSRWPKPMAWLLVFLCPPPCPTRLSVRSDNGDKVATVPFPPVVCDAELQE